LHAARRRATIAHHEGEDHAMSLSRRCFLAAPYVHALLWNIQV